ncbi:MAG: methylmalonyl-CoA carboxyltransferase, partial [Firmicutes bacterium]|nr:methylmalonyl-CoA carboxyltransferase [Bacillota bacterium]
MNDKLQLLEERRGIIESGGGDKRVADQHAKGKYTARERLQILLDPGSFYELDVFVQGGLADAEQIGGSYPGEGVVTGYGTIAGRPVYVFAQDFTVAGGSLGEMHAAKICKVMDLAMKNGAPLFQQL